MLFNNNKNAAYESQKRVSRVIQSQARDSASYYWNAMKPNTTVAIDGCWSHRRNAKFFFLALLISQTKRLSHSKLCSKVEERFQVTMSVLVT